MENETTKIWDLIIIGGGLAGLSHAILGGKDDLKVLLIEKSDYPKHKVCGEYISMESYDFLKELGLPFEDLHLPTINNFRLTSHHGIAASCKLSKGGFGISRYKLDRLLFELAKKDGSQIITNQKVTDVQFSESDNLYSVLLQSQQILKSKLVIGAYGRISGLEKRTTSNINSKNFIGVKYHVSEGPEKDTIEIHNFEGGYCGISQIEDGKYCLCYLTKADNLKLYKGDLHAFENNVMKKNAFLKERLESKILEGPITTSQFEFGVKSGKNHLLLSGDAAGFIPPITGNGMSLAFRSAKTLHPYIIQYFNSEISREKLLTINADFIYQYLNFRIKKGIFLQNLLFIKNPFLNKLLFKGLLGIPGLLKTLTRQATGKNF